MIGSPALPCYLLSLFNAFTEEQFTFEGASWMATPFTLLHSLAAYRFITLEPFTFEGASCWVTLEVFRQSIMYEELNMKDNVPEFSRIRHGWSYNLLWVCLVMFTFSGVVLIASSRNHKGLKARSFSQGGHGERGSPLWKDLGASKDQSVEGCGLASAT